MDGWIAAREDRGRGRMGGWLYLFGELFLLCLVKVNVRAGKSDNNVWAIDEDGGRTEYLWNGMLDA